MKRGYYQDIPNGEVIFVSGKKTGNAYYNLWADKPRWASIMFAILIDHPPKGVVSDKPPEDIPKAPGDK